MTETPEALTASPEPDLSPEQQLVRRAQGFAALVADAEQRGVLLEVIALASLAANRRAANRDWADRRRKAIRTMTDAERAQLNALRRMQRAERMAAVRPKIPVEHKKRSRPTTGLVVVDPLPPKPKNSRRNGIPPTGGVGGGVRASARTATASAVAEDGEGKERSPRSEAEAGRSPAEVMPISLDGGSGPTTASVPEKSSRPEGAPPPSGFGDPPPAKRRKRSALDDVAEAVLSDPLDRAGKRSKAAAPAGPKVTWLTPYYEAWKAAGGGLFNGGEAARHLGALEKEHGAAAVLERWKVMLSKTPLRFVSAFMLAKAWNDFAPGGATVAPVAERAATFWSVAVANRWMTARDRNDVQRELERTLAKGVVEFDAEEVLAFLFRINRRELNEAGAWAPKKLAQYGDVPVIRFVEGGDGEG